MLKSSFCIVKCLLAAIFLACYVEAIQFDCNFAMIVPWKSVIPTRYACTARVINSSSESLESVTGSHETGKSNEDVKYLFIIDQFLKNFPGGIVDFFKNVDALDIRQSALISISANDLRPFPSLLYLDLHGNELTSIDEDLFKYTPNLKLVSLFRNQIRHIGRNFVNNLNSLVVLYPHRNPCIPVEMYAEGRAQVLKLAAQLLVLCPPLVVTAITTRPGTTMEATNTVTNGVKRSPSGN